VAELTPDKKDFIITAWWRKGSGTSSATTRSTASCARSTATSLVTKLPMKPGDWYNAKMVEDTVDSLSETAGSLGYAFANVQPDFARNKDDLTMGINFRIAEAPRVYVERVGRQRQLADAGR
jgi:outer membrane protein insertion porin family